MAIFVSLVAIACALAISACGSSSKPKKTASSSGDFLAFSQCMRSHGVPNFPDPGSGGGISINSSSGINPFSPAFKAAQSQCQKLLPGGGPPKGPPSKQAVQAMLAVSKCMRAHGVSGFPDPTTTPPTNVGAAGVALAEGRNGVFLVVPSTIDVASPAFQSAASACHFGAPRGKTSPAG